MRISRITAFHEAGHAVAALRNGLLFDHVTAVPDEAYETDGALHWDELITAGDVAPHPHLLAIVLLAGACAEARLRGRAFDRVFAGDAAGDDREAIATMGLSDEEFIAAGRAVVALIDHEWPAIERVAHELLKGAPLQYADVARIADPA